MAKSDQAQISAIVETVIGTTPATPAFTKLRALSDSLSHQANTVDSAELSYTPGITGQARGGLNVSGSIEMPFAFNDGLDDFIVGVLGDAGGWTLGAAAVPAFTRHGFTIEKGYTDAAGALKYHRFIGCSASSLEIGYQPLQPISVSVGIVGGRFETGEAIIAGATYANPVPTPENAPQMRSAKVSIGWLGALAGLSGACVTSLSISLDRQNTARECIGRESAEEWELGTLKATIAATVLYTGNTAQIAQLADSEFGLTIACSDDRVTPNQNSYLFFFPRCKVSQAPVVTPAKGQDVTVALAIEALQPTGGDVVQITRNTA